MTEQNRSELRRGLEAVVRAAMGCTSPAVTVEGPANGHTRFRCLVAVREDDFFTAPPPEPPPLTTAQQLALSVLLSDEAVSPQALADYLLDQGHEYAVAVAEKARAEEREQSAIAAMMLTHDRADELRALPLYEMEAVALDDHGDWLRDRMMERA